MKIRDAAISRRNTLKMLAAGPLLPLAGALPAALLARPAQAAGHPLLSAHFVGMPAPGLQDPAAMARASVASQVVLSFTGGDHQSLALSYETFFVTGQMVPDGRGGKILAGGYYDIAGRPILDGSSAE